MRLEDISYGISTVRIIVEMMQVKEYAKGKTRTFVSFSSKLGEHTKKELLDMKDELIVMKVQSGKYKLAKHYYT